MQSTANAPVKVPRRLVLHVEHGIAAVTVGVPLLGIPLVMLRGVPTPFELVLFGALYVFSMLGITVGFHRLLSHRSFEATDGLRALLAIAGSTAWQGPPIRWAADHRRHHKSSDDLHDPHSPHFPTGGWRGALHAYAGWFFSAEKTRVRRFAPDLLEDAVLCRVNALYPVSAGLSLGAPALLGWAAGVSPWGAFVWGGLLRVAAVQHATWLFNVACHRWGTRPYRTKDKSRNNGFINLLVFGEGWHNNHHAFPASARQGLERNELDLSYQFIRLMCRVGAAHSPRLVNDAIRLRRLRTPASNGGMRSSSGPRDSVCRGFQSDDAE